MEIWILRLQPLLTCASSSLVDLWSLFGARLCPQRAFAFAFVFLFALGASVSAEVTKEVR
jgi:hypothetical protein